MAQAPAIEYKDLATLKVWARNYRHGDIGAITQSLLRFGFNGALRVWRDGVVIAGNHTLLALQGIKASGLQPPRNVREVNGAWHVAVIDCAWMTEIEAQAFAVADNRTSELADNDEQRLAELLTEIASEDAKLLAATGYDGDDLDAILSQLADSALGSMEAPDAQIDKADELREKWQTERGQLWAIGNHRLLCGDSTNADDVARVMDGECADMVFTDPPYNVGIVGGTHDPRDTKNYGKGNRIQNDSMSDADFDKFLNTVFANMHSVMRDGASYYVCAPPGRTETQFRNALEKTLTLRECIVWVKQQAVFGRQDYHCRHESILYGWKDGAAHYFIDDHTQTTVWEIDRPMRSEKEHPTQKPTELITRALNNSSKPKQTIYDLFLGSGTTLVACQQTGRKGRGIEIDPRYVAVTLQRLADMGLTPKLLN